MSDIDNLPILADALSTLDSAPMYTEARRQYETLGEESTDRNDKNSTAGASHLQHFYATLFECATEHLDWEQKMKLLTICFAYKTRSRVLCFLELVDPKSVAWRDPLKDVIERAGRDTMFPDAPAPRPTPKPTPKPASSFKAARKQLQRRKPNGASFTETNPRAAGCLAPAQQPNQAATNPTDSTPSFIIPTLPLAFPVHYLNAWATHIPLPKLTVESLFRQPVAYCLAVSARVEGMLRSRIPDASWSACEDTPSRHGEFFEYLLRGASKLPGVYTPDDDDDEAENAFEVDKRGYSLADVKRWVAVWKKEKRDRLGGESPRKSGKRKKMEDADDEDGEGESQTKKCVRFTNGVETLELPQAEPTGVEYAAPAPARCL